MQNQIDNKVDELVQVQEVALQATLDTITSKFNQLSADINQLKTEVLNRCEDNSTNVQRVFEQISSTKKRYDADYAEFIKDRKRWKATFDLASEKATQHADAQRELVTTCNKTAEQNSQALKKLLDIALI